MCIGTLDNKISGDFIFEDDRPELVDLENGTIALLTVGGIKQWVKLDWQDWNHISIKGINTCDVPYDECMEILDEQYIQAQTLQTVQTPKA